ncbi:hypothetical protein EMEDMD4_1070028 [Sinorhizobium medicae]|uniref:Uncharacterized protein n=1 Tax=Sinorhizobium medicae TaxID=110321 RepID=A0A508WPL3_9HYPH|nr:hypothetical protein EMEDMD4_1070028 [Sinorhizobium medicae]
MHECNIFLTKVVLAAPAWGCPYHWRTATAVC